METALTHADERRLKLVLEAGRSLEEIWALLPTPSDLALTKKREHALERLTQAIHALEQADNENLRRLSFHTRNLNLEMTSRHLATVLVPFERVSGKALRDDQILIDEGDDASILRSVRPLRVIADNLRSAFNVGAVLRTAECFGAEHVSLAGYTPTPDNEKTARTSLGTEKSVSWSSDPNIHDVIVKAKADGYAVVALETAQSAIPLKDFVWPERVALLLGNERFGLDRDVIDQADVILKIPMHGTKNSLNVGVACGIALASWRDHIDQVDRANRSNESSHKAAVTYQPIGTFRSGVVYPYEAPRQGIVDESGHESVIELEDDPQLKLALKDLEGFNRIWLIYDFHQNQNWKPLVLPPRGSHEKRGVFATRSPYRPNSIGLSCVELIRIEERNLVVRGTDLLDGTPILDIKPYVAYADAFNDSKLGWLEGLDADRCVVAFSQAANEKLQWLEENGASNLRGFLKSQLEFDATDSVRKRVEQTSQGFQLAYRTWRANFNLDQSASESGKKAILINDILSGYSGEDLDASEPGFTDRYLDKDLHRKFINRFK